MTALICMEELRHIPGSFIKIGSTSDCSAVLLVSLLPPVFQRRAVAASSSVNCCGGFSSKTFLVPWQDVLQRARGFSLLTSVREESTSQFVRCNCKSILLLLWTIIVKQYV